jgi:hypothetical protein
MSESDKVCSRPGCGKGLQARNRKGVCTSGCLSPEASPSVRARGVGAATDELDVDVRGGELSSKAKQRKETLQRFRVVASALGRDPDELLHAFAEGWLAELRGRLE